MTGAALQLRISDCVAEAKDVLTLELRPESGQTLPVFEPGAHLEVRLANGMIRHYSLCNSSAERDRYVVGVGRATNGRGGSESLHQTARVGTALAVTAVRNNFPLARDARRYRFIAGGIGITPILCMIRWCIENGAQWSLLYCARNRQRAAFYEYLAQWSDRVCFHFDDERGVLPDIATAVAAPDEGEHLYCCGPTALMRSVRDQSTGWADGTVHFEWFSAPEVDPTRSGEDSASDRHPFKIRLRQSGLEIEVAADQSILEALEQHGTMVPFSCREGLCRTCETGLCGGVADHRDLVLSEAEKAAQASILVCVSRARTPVLELDL